MIYGARTVPLQSFPDLMAIAPISRFSRSFSSLADPATSLHRVLKTTGEARPSLLIRDQVVDTRKNCFEKKTQIVPFSARERGEEGARRFLSHLSSLWNLERHKAGLYGDYYYRYVQGSHYIQQKSEISRRIIGILNHLTLHPEQIEARDTFLKTLRKSLSEDDAVFKGSGPMAFECLEDMIHLAVFHLKLKETFVVVPGETRVDDIVRINPDQQRDVVSLLIPNKAATKEKRHDSEKMEQILSDILCELGREPSSIKAVEYGPRLMLDTLSSLARHEVQTWFKEIVPGLVYQTGHALAWQLPEALKKRIHYAATDENLKVDLAIWNAPYFGIPFETLAQDLKEGGLLAVQSNNNYKAPEGFKVVWEEELSEGEFVLPTAYLSMIGKKASTSHALRFQVFRKEIS